MPNYRRVACKAYSQRWAALNHNQLYGLYLLINFDESITTVIQKMLNDQLICMLIVKEA